MALLILSGLQLIVTLGVGALLWRRLDRAGREIERLRKALNVAEAAAVAPMRRVQGGEAVRLTAVEASNAPRSITELRRRDPAAQAAPAIGDAATLSPETVRGLALAVAAALPAIGFFVAGAHAAIVAAGLVIAAGMMMVALRPLWRMAAWAGVITAGAWSLIGFALGATSGAPGIFSAAITIAGAAGLAHAHLRRAAPGVTMIVLAGAVTLALGVQIGMVSAAGAAFGALLALSAIVGAMSFRLENVHLAAFGAALIGLFALSGQHDAAIWFTPVTAWLGAVFLAIAALRVPELGARGLVIGGTGSLASIGGVAALHLSGHGLADPIAAAAAFALVALALTGVIVWAALHEKRGIAALGLTLWTLACAAFFALSAAVWTALPAPLAAPVFAACALGLAALDLRAPHAVWRFLAWSAGAMAVFMAAHAAFMLLSEARGWAPWALIALGLALPAMLAGGAAHLAERRKALATAGGFEAFAIVAGVAAANLTLRALAANGALMLAPIGFAEAGLHITIWLGAALMLAARAEHGARAVRRAAVFALAIASLIACAVAALLWLTPHWSMRNGVALIQFDALGFLAPAILFLAHWLFWRARDEDVRTRTALGAGAMMAAAFITLLTLQSRHQGLPGIDWLGVSIITLTCMLAIGANFAPGVTRAGASALNFHKNFHRPRRRQAGGEAG